MRKFWIFLVILCLVTGSMTVSAENFDVRDTITPGETKVITIPKPNGEVDEGWVYFTQEFIFVPEEDGIYRFLVAYEDDSKKTYDFSMGVTTEYHELENGCEFDAIAGETYELCFQYPIHDGRYPEFTFYLSAGENYHHKDTISPDETKVVTVPKPLFGLTENWVYFTQEFTFVPQEDGTYRFLIGYEEDESKPYDIYMDVSGTYRELENGCEFDAIAGETYELRFQYPNHDGRYPEFTFYLGSESAERIPNDNILLYCAAGALLVCCMTALLIAERKKNMNPDPL